MGLSNTINRLSESATIAMSRKSRELQAQGIDVISLSLGEPDFNTPDFIKEAAKKAIDENYSKYTPVPGHLSLREAISKKFKEDNNLEYSPSQITVSTGAKQCIANAVLTLIIGVFALAYLIQWMAVTFDSKPTSVVRVVLDEIVDTVISHVSPTDETTTKYYQMKSKERMYTPVPRFTVFCG